MLFTYERLQFFVLFLQLCQLIIILCAADQDKSLFPVFSILIHPPPNAIYPNIILPRYLCLGNLTTLYQTHLFLLKCLCKPTTSSFFNGHLFHFSFQFRKVFHIFGVNLYHERTVVEQNRANKDGL